MMSEQGYKRRENFYHDIRRKQIEFQFRMLRTTELSTSKSESNAIAIQHFKELKNVSSRERMTEILKELRELIICYNLPEVINNYSNISILLDLQQLSQLDNITQVFIHQILSQITTYKFSRFSLSDIRNWDYLDGQRAEIINVLLQVIGNTVIKNESFESLRFLIKEKQIFKKLVNLLFSPKHIFRYIEVNLRWLSILLISSAKKLKLEKLDETYCLNVAMQTYNHIKDKILRWDSASLDQLNIRNLQQIYFDLITIIRFNPDIVNFQKKDAQVLQKIEQQFDAKNLKHIKLLTNILYHYNYQIPLELLSMVMLNFRRDEDQSSPQSKRYYEQIISHSLKIAINSIENDRSIWKHVLEEFTDGSQKLTNLKLKEQYPFTGLFIYFFDDPRFKIDVFNLIKQIWICQGYIGIFEESLQVFIETEEQQIIDYLIQSGLIQF